MKRILFASAAAIVLCASAFALDEAKDFTTFMKGVLPKVAKGFDTKNLAVFKSISTPDFSETMDGQTMTKEQSMAGLKSAFDSAKTIKAKLRLLSTKKDGSNWTAMTAGHIVMVMKPTKGDPKTHTMVMDMWQKETWVKSGKTWKIKHIAEAKPMKMMMDGKPFNPSNFSPGGGG